MSNLQRPRFSSRAELWLARRVSQGNLNSDELPQRSRAWRPAADGWHSGYHKVTGAATTLCGRGRRALGAREGGRPSGLRETGGRERLRESAAAGLLPAVRGGRGVGAARRPPSLAPRLPLRGRAGWGPRPWRALTSRSRRARPAPWSC